jgi:tetratricopeptide (TPR) repeat protein
MPIGDWQQKYRDSWTNDPSRQLEILRRLRREALRRGERVDATAALSMMSAAAERLGDFASAVRYLTQACREGELPMHYKALGNLYSFLGKKASSAGATRQAKVAFGRAREAFVRAIALAPAAEQADLRELAALVEEEVSTLQRRR